MGGIGFITSYKAECMLSVLINTNLLMQAKKKIKKFFFFLIFSMYLSNQYSKRSKVYSFKRRYSISSQFRRWLWMGKTFSERMCKHFFEDFNLEVSVATIS